MQNIILHWTVPEAYNQKLLREYLRNEQKISRQGLTDLKQRGSILLNGENVTVRAVVNMGDMVTVIFPPEERSEGLQPIEIPLDIVYEDDHLLVINKQANLPTIPSIYHPNRSLANGVLFYYELHKIPCTFHAVNRLDRDTSGLLVVAKHRYAHDLMSQQQKKGKVKRTYLAIVHGHLVNKNGTINEPIGRKDDSIIEREVRIDGQMAVTHYEVVRTLKEETVVKLSLETGRTHQIRVHMAYIGHPLVGDDLYGGKVTKLSRQALHSYQLQFFHPINQEELHFTVHPPEDMGNLIK
ncbi:RluA family pseudouridine synthase [Anaerobacillus alkaliphilus]|uniref:Pseudouridine synthase n=1 Tax=Anaerobacillus alkaliphilus TaxID=1548597 RepID=A0A4Q0VPQ4_9BACI|nr:RluA family pseudouridine synthase [Anaerobacillus alkaliphilus]RXI98228.1 RluA family pseudouridine synthase [Anaerobacillus alkaliphilus]